MTLACCSLLGCLPRVHTSEARTVRDVAGAEPLNRHEQRDDGAGLETQLEGDLLTVAVTARSSCRDIRDIPAEQLETTSRTLDNPVKAQLFNAALTIGLLAAGSGVLYKGLSGDPTTEPVVGFDIAGVGLLVGSLIPGSFFVANFVRATDSVEVTPTKPVSYPGPWLSCPTTASVEGMTVSVEIGGQTMVEVTNDDGVAVFDLSTFTNLEQEPTVAKVSLGNSGIPSTKVALGEAAVHERWEADGAEKKRRTALNEKATTEKWQRNIAAFGGWVDKNIQITRTQTTTHVETCFNRVDTRVPCDGAAAFKKEVEDSIQTKFEVRNGSKTGFACQATDSTVDSAGAFRDGGWGQLILDSALGKTQTAFAVPAGKTASGTIELKLMFSAGVRLLCAIPSSGARESGALLDKELAGESIVFAAVWSAQASDPVYVFGIGDSIFAKKGDEYLDLSKGIATPKKSDKRK